MNKELMFSSKTDDLYTPIDFYETLNDEFHFTLDPCANDHNHKCDKYYTREQDGLKHDGGGRLCFAIHHMEEKLRIELKNVMLKVGRRIQQ